jgi:ATP-binding cassette subfamily B protein
MKRILELSKGCLGLYAAAVISIGIASFIAMVEPMVIKITIDSIIGNKPVEANAVVVNFVEYLGGRGYLSRNIWICSLSLVSLTFLQGIFLYFKGKLSGQAAENMARNVKVRLYDHIQNLPYAYYVNAKSGDLIQRCTSDVETVRKFFAVEMVDIGRAVFIVIFAVFMMNSMNSEMTVISMLMVPVIFVFALVFFNRVHNYFKTADEQEGVLTTVLRENLTGVRVVKAFGRENFEIDKYEIENEKYRIFNNKIIVLMSNYWGLSDFLCTIQIGLVLVSGIIFTVNGQISLGSLVVFITYETMLLWPVRQLGRILSDMGKMKVSINRIWEVLQEPLEADNGKGLKPEIKGDISFDNVTFGYQENNDVIKNVSFKVNKGETVAIVGPTGSGKSSLVHLLLRLYDYKSGSIKIDGVELKDISRKWIRENIGIVLQESFLYSRTIKDNIKISKLDADDFQVSTAAKMAAVHGVITSFDKGYDTLVGENGVTLSGGQRQRVSIARVLIKDHPVLIFDDSLSAVDTGTDKIIREKLEEKSSRATTFIISHRISTIMNADKIIVLNQGEIEASGTHEELLSVEGTYKRIWEIQNSPMGFAEGRLWLE